MAENEVPQTLNEWRDAAYANAVAHGFWEGNKTSFGDRIALLHSELSEAFDEYRDGHGVTKIYFKPEKPTKPEGIPTELADVLIRVFDLCGHHGIDIQAVVAQKHAYNLSRPYKHGKKL